ncbi:hypothetical protein M0802_001366 [Mischocyttarus mexicanus]|nr:hypothetical protein M0802_001366 [Mischocyttarus mexicanus]
MTLPLMFIIFWMFIITWLVYRWCWDNESDKIISQRKGGNLTKKFKTRKSTTSIESLDMSENEDLLPKCHKRKIKQQAKTRWPSRTSIND